MFKVTSINELLKVPRIAIIHGDPAWSKFLEPIKEAFEIPPTIFQDISIDKIQDAFFDKMAQYLLCIICPHSSTWKGMDLTRYAEQWHQYFNQGSSLMIFGIDVDWLEALGARFRVKGTATRSTSITRYNFDETSIARNALAVEELDMLGPWLGEYSKYSPAWKPVSVSASGNPTILTQIFGNAQITLCSCTMEKGNAKKIFPVKVLIWGMENSIIAEKSDSTVDREKKVASSMALSSRVVSKRHPCILEVSMDSFQPGGLPAQTLTVAYSILLPSQNLVKSGTFQSNITDGSRGIFNVFEFDVHEIPDGTYELALEIGGAEIHHECKFEIYIVTSELEQLMDHVIKVGTRTRSELARLEKMLSHLQNVPSSLDTELLRRLLYLRQRITCFFETIDNMLQWHVPRPEDIDVICAAGTSIVFHAMKDVRKFHDEVIARSLGIPGFTIPREWNFGETASQQFLTLLATLTSDLGTEIHWEVVGDVSLGGLLGIREKKERDYLLSIYSNGIPVLSAGIILHSKASIDRVRQKIGTEQPASMSAKGSIFKNKEALIVVKDETTHGFKAGTGRIIVDTMEISISATSSEGIKKVAGCILDGRLIDMHAVNALAEITLDTGSSDLGLLQELEATSKDLSFDQYTRSVAAQLENGSMSWAVADFHSHSAASDGVFKPQDVAIFAACAGIDIYGLSDHHSIAPSMFLANLAHQKHWRLAIIPGCQEVTHIYFHAISLGATATVIESVPVDKIPNEVQKTGAFLNFAHTRLPHPWPTQQMALGSASSFQSFDFSERIIHDNWTAWNNDARIPVLTESTGTDIGTFGSRSRTIAFFPSKSRDTLLDSDDLPRLLVEALKHDECIALAGQVLFGKLKNIILAQAIIRAKKGPIKEKYEKKKLAKFLSLI